MGGFDEIFNMEYMEYIDYAEERDRNEIADEDEPDQDSDNESDEMTKEYGTRGGGSNYESGRHKTV